MSTKEIRPEDITCIYDTREQLPYDLSPMRSERGTLTTGDYSVRGLTHLVAIERKSLSDYLGSIGNNRDAFEREMQRMLGYPYRCLVIEANWDEMEAGAYERSKMGATAVMGSTIGWMMKGIPVAMVGTREAGQRTVARMLFCAARRRWEEALSLLPTLRIAR